MSNIEDITKDLGKPKVEPKIEKINVKLDKDIPAPTPDMDIIKTLQAQIEQMREQNKVLFESVDKARLAKARSKGRGKENSIVGIRTIMVEGKDKAPVLKVIVGSQSIVDDVYQDPRTGTWKENQQVKLLFADGTSEVMMLVMFIRNYRMMSSEEIGKSTEGGETFLKLKAEDGKTYKINVKSVN